MEAHGAVTRSRLTPAVAVVIVDASVSADHPTVRNAGTLGIPVLEPAEAINQFAGWRRHPDARSPVPPDRPAPTTTRRFWLFRRSAH
jgi:hypothetical protein